MQCDCDISYSTDYDINGNKQITMTIQYCQIHNASLKMFDVLEELAAGSCCQTPGCGIDDPKCDTMMARYAINGLGKLP